MKYRRTSTNSRENQPLSHNAPTSRGESRNIIPVLWVELHVRLQVPQDDFFRWNISPVPDKCLLAHGLNALVDPEQDDLLYVAESVFADREAFAECLLHETYEWAFGSHQVYAPQSFSDFTNILGTDMAMFHILLGSRSCFHALPVCFRVKHNFGASQALRCAAGSTWDTSSRDRVRMVVPKRKLILLDSFRKSVFVTSECKYYSIRVQNTKKHPIEK